MAGNKYLLETTLRLVPPEKLYKLVSTSCVFKRLQIGY